MGEIKDGIELGIEMLQFWSRFKGKRVRVWPTELTIRLCSEAGKWVTSPDGAPPWWKESRERYAEDQRSPASHEDRDSLLKYAANHLANPQLPNIETVEEAKLLEATVSDIIKNPPGIYLTQIQYWVVLDDASGKRVAKVDSQDDGMLLPLNQLARIDFVRGGVGVSTEKSSWSLDDSPSGLLMT
jgi:hypothetical protein